jgi:benzoyl-CoA reductase subunit BamC
MKQKVRKILIDFDKCTGCRHCETACALAHITEDAVNPRFSRIKVFVDLERGYNYPVISGPYTDAKCTSKGYVTIKGETFDTCTICRAACPEKPFFFEPGTEVPLKCDLCGEPPDPNCVKWCTSGALQFVEIEEEVDDVVNA